MSDPYIWETAKIREADVGFEDHGIFTLFATFDYGGSYQGLSYGADLEFIKQFINACGIAKLSQCKGRIVMVRHSDSKIVAIKPMKFEPGELFNIEAWSESFKMSEATKAGLK